MTQKSKTRKSFIIVFFVFLVAAGVYYFVFQNGMSIFGPRMTKGLIKSYQLYTPEDEKKDVVLFLGNDGSEEFKMYKTNIYATHKLVNQIKQVLLLLTGEPPFGYISLLPEGTFLREAYLDANNILYVDFTEDITLNHKGGTTGEYLTVYSIINTVFYNFPWVRGMRILIDGKETDTIAGHINIEGILVPDTDFSEGRS